MSSSETGSDQVLRLRRAKDYYNKVKGDADDTKLQSALTNFKCVVMHCACNKTLLESSQAIGLSVREIPVPTCHCKDFVSLAANPDADDTDGLAMYRLATKPCNCGSGITSCPSPTHIAALDGMSAVCEAKKDYARATQYASLLLIVAPHAPEGYLRLVKDLRLQARSTETGVTSQCTYILAQAAGSVRVFGDKNHGKLKAIRQMLRSDPMRRLPVEVQQMILQYLPFSDLCRALAVSRTWNRACRNASLWTHLEFVKYWTSTKRGLQSRRPFRPGVLNDIISKRSQNLAKSLTINGTYDFGIKDTLLRSILRALPRLESLSLSGAERVRSPFDYHSLFVDRASASFDRFMNVICEEVPVGLEVLRLDFLIFEQHPPGEDAWPRKIGRFSESLVELTLTDLVDGGGFPLRHVIHSTLSSTSWPKLEKLTIDTEESSGGFAHIPIANFADFAPSLKDLTLNRFNAIYNGSAPLPKLLGNLERLSIGRHRGSIPLATPKLRSVEIVSKGAWAYDGLFFLRDTQSPTDVWLENLEHLCCINGTINREDSLGFNPTVWSSYNFERIKPSCTNGTLRSLHISFDLATRDGLDKVLNKPAIHTLSCHDIAVMSNHFTGGDFDAFLEWLDTFPALHTVGVFTPLARADSKTPAWTLIARLLKTRPDIKTIYTDALRGAPRDEVLERAEKIGVNVIHARRVPEPVLGPVAPAPGPALQLKAHQNDAEDSQNAWVSVQTHDGTG